MRGKIAIPAACIGLQRVTKVQRNVSATAPWRTKHLGEFNKLFFLL